MLPGRSSNVEKVVWTFTLSCPVACARTTADPIRNRRFRVSFLLVDSMTCDCVLGGPCMPSPRGGVSIGGERKNIYH